MVLLKICLVFCFLHSQQLRTAVSEGHVRLVSGHPSSLYVGRVEIYHNGQWGTVCDDGWDLTDADVVCKQLGYTGAHSYTVGAFYGQGNGKIWMDNVRCRWCNSRLRFCRFSDHSSRYPITEGMTSSTPTAANTVTYPCYPTDDSETPITRRLWLWHTPTSPARRSTGWWWQTTTAPPRKEGKSATSRAVITGSAISAVYVFLLVIIIIVAVRARGRPVATTTTTARGQLSAGRPAHAQSVIVPFASQNVEYPGVHFSSNESGAWTSYEAAIAYPAATKAVNFDGKSCDGSACDASNDNDCGSGCDCDCDAD
ncbi:deleted in malignant brain tumors 1 protein-like isoform X2 [Corticium candelabrum]|uniref:deleted in malignant brain tumors 1 protein-like isoform X2 n=1 Tax=Corticium candelabrum TaxID=121492 RepID=UPI002E25E0DF|nr:deleted in malignant brain tumors 1 protein-like isoform X2 [Corticium candelabrum]